MSPLLLAVALAAHLAVAPGPATQGPPPDLVPLPWAVCVTTADLGRPRFDSYWNDRAEAQARRDEIIATGWVAIGDDGSEEDRYGPGSIVKATVDGTDDVSICQPPPVQLDTPTRNRVPSTPSRR